MVRVQDTDYQLIERWRAGEQSAFEQLFQRHYSQVYRVAYAFAQAHDEADDLTQETFLALYQHPPQLTIQANLLAWLCRVVTNKAYNQLRSMRREQARMFTQLAPPIAAQPFDHLLRNEEHIQVQQALAQLPERQASLLSLRASGLSYAEVADALGIAKGSVGTLLARAEQAFLQAYMALERADLTQAA